LYFKQDFIRISHINFKAKALKEIRKYNQQKLKAMNEMAQDFLN